MEELLPCVRIYMSSYYNICGEVQMTEERGVCDKVEGRSTRRTTAAARMAKSSSLEDVREIIPSLSSLTIEDRK